MRNDPLIPNIAVVTDIRVDTPDVKTFRVVGLDGKKPFVHIPGQCAMLSVPGVGEALFSITSSPTLEEYVEFSHKKEKLVLQYHFRIIIRLLKSVCESVVMHTSVVAKVRAILPGSEWEEKNQILGWF